MSDCAKILAILQTGRSITSFQAFVEIGCTRLAARIHDLRRRGYNIVKTMIEGTDRNGNPCKYASYKLMEGNQ